MPSDPRLAAMAQQVLDGHRGKFGEPCSECGQLQPCHAWTLANEIVNPLPATETPDTTELVSDDER